MVKRNKDQKLRLRNFDAKHEKIETGAVVKSHKGLSGVERGKGICYQWKEKGSVRKETYVVSGMREVVCREKEMSEAEARLRISIDRRVNTS